MKVGDKCEFQWRNNPWYLCTILYMGSRFAVIEKDGIEIVKYLQYTSFRPIRDEREKAIVELATLIGGPTPISDATRIYAEGYRKK